MCTSHSYLSTKSPTAYYNQKELLPGGGSSREKLFLLLCYYLRAETLYMIEARLRD